MLTANHVIRPEASQQLLDHVVFFYVFFSISTKFVGYLMKGKSWWRTEMM